MGCPKVGEGLLEEVMPESNLVICAIFGTFYTIIHVISFIGLIPLIIPLYFKRKPYHFYKQKTISAATYKSNTGRKHC